ncbi:hypothetical protein B0H13DRAFT_2669312 [Mycena leptocephala]|nr:hypothetical protein B0H13DRAFT_2669312 [Mycena leptocephala]
MHPQYLFLSYQLSRIDAQLTAIKNRRIPPHVAKELSVPLLGDSKRLLHILHSTSCPILSLPDSVTSKFFVDCLPDTPSKPDSAVAPLLFRNICHEWRKISDCTPALWSTLKADFTYDTSIAFERSIQEWLGCTRRAPLTIIFTFDWLYHCCTSRTHAPGAVPHFRSSVLDTVIARSSQWENIDFDLRAPCAAVRLKQTFHCTSHTLPRLKTFRLRMSAEFPTPLTNNFFDTPVLSEVDLAAVSPSAFLRWENLTTFSGENLTPDDCIDVFRRAPQLVSCLFSSNWEEFCAAPTRIYGFHHYAIPTTPVPPHNNLCRHSLDPVGTHGYSSTCFKLLPLLTFPCLSQLTFEYAPDNAAEADSFLSFIRRSPCLDTFIAGVSNTPPSSIAPCLAATPALKTLVLQCDIINMLEVLRLLKDSSSFLPCLQTIVIDLVDHFNSDGVATDIEDKLRPLVAALSARSEEKPGLAKLLRCALLLDKYDPAKFSFATYQMLKLEEVE